MLVLMHPEPVLQGGGRFDKEARIRKANSVCNVKANGIGRFARITTEGTQYSKGHTNQVTFLNQICPIC